MADNNDFDRQNRTETRNTDTGTRIHVEKERKPNWLWLLVPLILGLLVLPNLFNRDNDRVGTTVERNAEVAAVTYQGERWQADGPAQTLNVNELRRIGTSDEGIELYQANVGGGGGMGSETVQRTFMKAADGRFVPLVKAETNTNTNTNNE